MVQKLIDHFEIPIELAKELSNLLTTQFIREKLLQQVIGDPVKYKQAEDLLIPIVEKVEAIKLKITIEHVPDQYQNPIYLWNYNGWEVDGNRCQVLQEVKE